MIQSQKKKEEHLKNNMDRSTFVRAMAELLMTSTQESIKIPSKYKDQVYVVKELLKCDTSGIINSLLDFAITCGQVEYSVETDNDNLTELFNSWLISINEELRGQIPTGIGALSKEYYRERWKGSSFLLLRSIWENKNGFVLPTKLWFVNGEDIVIDDKNLDTANIGKEKYLLQIKKNEQKVIPFGKDEKIFVQKPYESWGTTYPTPFLIRRGLYKNLKLLDILSTKGEYVITKALEYLLLLKKGSEALALSNQSDFIYSKDDLEKIKGKMEELLENRRTTPGVPTYATNFDTEMTHLIPEYEKILKQELYAPMERRLLAGLGLIDVLQGVSSTRRESTLNPRPFITEVESGIKDFKMILSDILHTIVDLNRIAHPKYIGNIQKIHSTPISQFITDDVRTQFRSMYDRGVISKRTYVEVVGDLDFLVEYNRRKMETPAIMKTFYPPVTQNMEASPNEGDAIPADKTGIEKKNFKKAQLEDIPEIYKNTLPPSGQKLWVKIYNSALIDHDDSYALKVAEAVIAKLYKSVNDKLVLKKKIKSISGQIVLSEEMIDKDDIDQELKKVQLELSKKLLGDKDETI
jgi:cation transport regulator ChaB